MDTPKVPTISIVTPSFQQGQFLERTINSVLSQKGPFFLDYQVIDGGSTDQTVSILKSFESELSKAGSRVHQDGLTFLSDFPHPEFNGCRGISFRWISEKDRGQSHAINKGWEKAIGSIVAFLNSDDVYLPNALEYVLQTFSKNPDAMVVYGGGLHISTEDKLIELYPSESFNYDRLKTFCIICQPTTFIRREVLDQFGFIDENLRYCMDYEYWLRIGRHVKFHFTPRLLACTRLYQDTKTLRNPSVVAEEIVRMQTRLLGRASDHWINCLSEIEARHKTSWTQGRSTDTTLIQFAFALHRLKNQVRFNRHLSASNCLEVLRSAMNVIKKGTA